MEKLARRIADVIGDTIGQDEEKRQVIAYGLAALLQMLVIFAVTFVIGLAGGFAIESMVLFLGVGLLRKAVGGAHAGTMAGCLVISITFITLLAAASRYLFNFQNSSFVVIVLSAFFYIVSLILIYKLAPFDTPKKPIVKPKKIERLRKEAFITLFIYFAATAILICFYRFNSRCLNVAVSFSLAAIWQCLMLTKAGHAFIAVINRFFISHSNRN